MSSPVLPGNKDFLLMEWWPPAPLLRAGRGRWVQAANSLFCENDVTILTKMQPSGNHPKASGNIPLADELSKLIPQLNRFISTAIHDIRSPLNSSAALAQLLLKKFGSELQPEARWLMEQIVIQLKQQTAVIAGIEEYAAVLNSPKLSFASISLDSVITGALGNLKKEILDSGAKLRAPQCRLQ